MTLTLPPLPYPYHALEPVISAATSYAVAPRLNSRRLPSGKITTSMSCLTSIP